jgi:hypothetical protein
VGAGGVAPAGHVGEDHAGANDVVHGEAGFLDRGADDRQAAASLAVDVAGAGGRPVVGDRGSSGDGEERARGDGVTEADLRLERRA